MNFPLAYYAPNSGQMRVCLDCPLSANRERKSAVHIIYGALVVF